MSGTICIHNALFGGEALLRKRNPSTFWMSSPSSPSPSPNIVEEVKERKVQAANRAAIALSTNASNIDLVLAQLRDLLKERERLFEEVGTSRSKNQRACEEQRAYCLWDSASLRCAPRPEHLSELDKRTSHMRTLINEQAADEVARTKIQREFPHLWIDLFGSDGDDEAFF